MSDYEIVCKIAERLGLLEEYTGGKTVDELIKIGYETPAWRDLISWEEFNEKGYYVVPTDPDWEKIPAGLIEFYEDPEKHPLTTPTGKLEFYSTGLAEHFPDDDERPPVPQVDREGRVPRGDHRHRAGEEVSAAGHDQPPALGRALPARRHHLAPGDRDLQGRGARRLPVPAAVDEPGGRRSPGHQDGDVVNIYNERGTVLAGAYVTERIMPGAVGIDHGAKYDPIVPGEIDRGGAINTIVPRNTDLQERRRAWRSAASWSRWRRTDLEALRSQVSRGLRPGVPPGCRSVLRAGV